MPSDNPLRASYGWRTIGFRPAPTGTRIVYFGYDTDESGKTTHWTHIRPCPGWLIQEKVLTETRGQHEPGPYRRVVVADYNWFMLEAMELVAACAYADGDSPLMAYPWKVLAPDEAPPSEGDVTEHLSALLADEKRRQATDHAVPRQGNGNEVISNLFGALPWCDGPETWAPFVKEFDESHKDDELEDGSPRTYDHWSDFEKTFARMVERLVDSYFELTGRNRQVLSAPDTDDGEISRMQ